MITEPYSSSGPYIKAAAKGDSRAEFELASMTASAEGLGRALKRARIYVCLHRLFVSGYRLF